MAPGPTTLLPVLGAETLPGAADLTQEALGAGAADETLGQAGTRVTGPRVDEPRARRLAGSAAHPRTAVRHDATRFADEPKKPATETSARVDYPRVEQPGVEHSGPLALVTGIGFELEFWTYPFALSPTSLLNLLPARAPEELLIPSLPPVRTPSSSDLIGEIFGGGPNVREKGPLLVPRVARTDPSSEVATGPDVFRNRIVRSVPPGGDSPKPPRPFRRVLDLLGTGEFIMNPLTALLVLDKIQAVNPVALEVMGAEDITIVTLRLTGLKTEIDRSIDAEFTGLDGSLTWEARGVFDGARIGLKLAYDEALTRVSQIFAQARQSGFVALELQDVEALLTLAGYRDYSLPSFLGYSAGCRMRVMELTRLIRDEILGPRGTQRRENDVSNVFRLARLNAPSPHQDTMVSEISPDARSLRPEKRRDEEPSDATDTPLIVGTTASAGADADTDDQGEERDHPNQ